jgi:hypothetical protein
MLTSVSSLPSAGHGRDRCVVAEWLHHLPGTNTFSTVAISPVFDRPTVFTHSTLGANHSISAFDLTRTAWYLPAGTSTSSVPMVVRVGFAATSQFSPALAGSFRTGLGNFLLHQPAVAGEPVRDGLEWVHYVQALYGVAHTDVVRSARLG